MTDVVVVVHFPFRCRFIAPVFASHVLIQYSIKWIHLTNMLRSWPSWWTCPFRCRFIAPGHCCTRSYAIFNSIQFIHFNNIRSIFDRRGRRLAFVPFDVGSSLRDIALHVLIQYSIKWIHLNNILWICDGRGRRDAYAPFDVGSSLRDIAALVHMQYSIQYIHFNDIRSIFDSCGRRHAFVPFDVGSSLRDIPSHVHMQYSIIWFHLNCILWICDGRGRRDAFAPFDVGSSLRDITPHIHMQYSNQSLISITFFEYVMDVVVVIHFNDQRCRFTEVEKGISFAFRFSPWQQRLIANGF
jgi:hypothetical protein